MVSPRRLTLDPLSAATRRPLSVVTTTDPNRYRPVISTASEKPSSPFKSRPREPEPHYILPASSSRRDHHRTYSADNSDPQRSLADGRDRPERGGYRSSGIGGSRQGYNLNVPLVRQPKDTEDRDYGYEYTDRKEQMYRDTAPRLRPRRESDSGRRERPLSMTGLEDYAPRMTQVSRDGPPVTIRGFDKLDRTGSLRREYRIPREPDPGPRDDVSRDYAPGKSSNDSDGVSRRRSTRAPVALHQDPDDGYLSYRDERDRHHHSSRRNSSLDRGNDDRGLGIRAGPDDDSRRGVEERPRRHHESPHRRERGEGEEKERHHGTSHRTDRDDLEDRERKPREDRHKSKHGESKGGEDLALGAAGIAATGLAAEAIRPRHHRDKGSIDESSDVPTRDRAEPRDVGRLAVIPDPSETSSRNGEFSDDERKERRRRRRKEKEEEALREEMQRGRNDDLALPRDDTRRESGSYDRNPRYPGESRGEPDEARTSRRRHHHRTSEEASYSDESGDNDRQDPNRHKTSLVRVVSPDRDDKPDAKPKGILRPPREKFPEDPAPVREGVAPLKDAGKKGIPPNARWTKIDRKLVNPAALNQGNERFEERPDYVIVLRVLTKEEIEAYAQRTQEIRGKRPALAGDEESADS